MTRTTLKRLARQWVDDAMADLGRRSEAERSTALTSGGPRRWVRVDDRHFQHLDQDGVTFWSYSFREHVEALPSYRRFVDGMLADPDLGPQLFNLVGTVLRRSRVEPSSIAIALLPKPGAADVAYDFDLAWSEAFQRFDSDRWTYTTIVPISGLALVDGSVELDERSRIVVLSDEDVEKALLCDLLPRTLGIPPDRFMLPVGALTGLKFTTELAKVVGHDPGPLAGPDSADAVYASIISKIEAVGQCLALLTERARIVGHVTDDGEGGTSAGHGELRHLVISGAQPLSPDEQALFQTVWRLLTIGGVGMNMGLELAMRRIAFAHDRLRSEDKLLDLMIAAEAFYLPGERTELSYKLALRAAYWNDDPEWSRTEVKRFMAHAYDLRSTIAHGTEPNPRKVKVKGEVVGMHVFVATLKGLLRSALLKAVRLAVEGDDAQRPTIDWDGLVLQEADDVSTR